MPEKVTKKKASTRKKPKTAFKKGNTAASAKKLTEDEKVLKKLGRTQILKDVDDVIMKKKYNIRELASDTSKPPFLRGLAQMAIRLSAEGQLKDVEFIMKVYGVNLNHATVDVGGSYADYLFEVAKKAGQQDSD